jgi:hypothetical protein
VPLSITLLNPDPPLRGRYNRSIKGGIASLALARDSCSTIDGGSASGWLPLLGGKLVAASDGVFADVSSTRAVSDARINAMTVLSRSARSSADTGEIPRKRLRVASISAKAKLIPTGLLKECSVERIKHP